MFVFGTHTPAVLFAPLCGDLVRELWYGFCFRRGELALTETDALSFTVGEAPPVALAGRQYAYAVTDAGICVRGEDRGGLMQGMLELMRRIRLIGDGEEPIFAIPCGEGGDSTDIGVRMIHFCVFPETTLAFLRRSIRLAAALHYTHVVLEFWGTFPFSCMPELAWPEHLRRDDVQALADEIRLLGMEPVPMFNHLGHAAASRESSGKHVVLDQNPARAMYFADNGWTWAIGDPRVPALLRDVRAELYAVMGPGSFVHLGFDEAYLYGSRPDLAGEMCDFLCTLTREVLEREGRRPIIWGDMLLDHAVLGTTKADYSCNCHDHRIADRIFAALDRRVIIADWQYHKKTAPVITTPYFAGLGFDVLTCPWDTLDNVRACVDTVRQSGTLGVMHTTWHTLSGANGMGAVFACAEWCRAERADTQMTNVYTRPEAATLLRRLTTEFEGYAASGWVRNQIIV